MLIVISVRAFIREIKLSKEERFCPEIPLIISLYFIFLEVIIILI